MLHVLEVMSALLGTEPGICYCSAADTVSFILAKLYFLTASVVALLHCGPSCFALIFDQRVPNMLRSGTMM